MSDLNGKIYEVSNGHLSYEIFNATSDLVPVLGELIQIEFGISKVSSPAIGLSEVVVEIELEGSKLGLGWDNWYGAYIMAFCDKGDKHIRKISHMLNEELKKSKYRKHIENF